jgi:hypothetical protein
MGICQSNPLKTLLFALTKSTGMNQRWVSVMEMSVINLGINYLTCGRVLDLYEAPKYLYR